MGFLRDLLGKPSHVPSQRKGVVGLIQDAIQLSAPQGQRENRTSGGSSADSCGVSRKNQRKLDEADRLDSLAGDALARGDKKAWESCSRRAQEVDDSIQ